SVASVSAEEIMGRLKEKGKNEEIADEFSSVIRICEMAIYSPESSSSVTVEETYTKATGLLDNLLKVL
ncbi:MAG: hypothetical protein IIC40_08435, partial [Candidatus Marinimicrobia bacterium]|nr:hypothetical protein [Candidatus Neomarinimicrobiota bacterium]